MIKGERIVDSTLKMVYDSDSKSDFLSKLQVSEEIFKIIGCLPVIPERDLEKAKKYFKSEHSHVKLRSKGNLITTKYTRSEGCYGDWTEKEEMSSFCFFHLTQWLKSLK